MLSYIRVLSILFEVLNIFFSLLRQEKNLVKEESPAIYCGDLTDIFYVFNVILFKCIQEIS